MAEPLLSGSTETRGQGTWAGHHFRRSLFFKEMTEYEEHHTYSKPLFGKQNSINNAALSSLVKKRKSTEGTKRVGHTGTRRAGLPQLLRWQI